MSRSSAVRLVGISKSFGNVVALEDVNLEIEPGEFFTLLGPSGCGKTTLLRIVAGLETPTTGTIYIDDKAVNELSPGDRDVAMVFQSYALYAHMKVFDNLAFPLRMVKVPEGEIQQRVVETAQRLHIEDLLDRKPGQLSGGQQQRVALGRAIVREPHLFLMDEPLSNLDARLRLEMRVELKALVNQLKVTTVYVTHDQEEAMTMSSRIAVFEAGHMLQVGTPEEIYNRPANVMVARFVGSLPMNFFTLDVVDQHDLVILQGDHVRHVPQPEIQQKLRQQNSRQILLGIRPKDVEVFEHPPAGGEAFPVEVFVVEPIGDYTIIDFQLGGEIYKARLEAGTHLRPGDHVWINIAPSSTHLFNSESGLRVA